MPGPYNFNSQWKSARNLVLSTNSQLVWNTALADAALTMRQRFDGSAVVETSPTRRSDIDYAGKGTAFATNGQVTSFDTKLSGLKHEASPASVGWALAFLMGHETVVGANAPYTHTLTFDESTRTAVPTTVYVEDTEDLHYKCPDMCVNDVTLTINDIGAIMVESNLIGTGRKINGSMAAIPALAAESYILGSDAVPTFGPVGAPAAFTGRLMSATFKFENQLAVHKAPGGGQYGIFVRKGNPKFSFNATIAAKDADDVYTLFENDTDSAFAVNANSGAAAQLGISVPHVHLKTTKLGFDGEMVVWQIEGDETTCYAVPGAPMTPPISVSVVNGVPAYLVGA
ncbi:MAG: phage tail tube protein [Terracidiphilus sp.]|nr:phage tail tube protein [Terracidiphilus sp.]